MIQLPTDSLFKFLAISGIALIIFGVTIPLDKFNKSDLQRINALEKAQEFGYAYSDYAKEVNKEISAYKNYVRNPSEKNKIMAAEIIGKNEPAINKLNQTTREAMIKSQTQMKLAEHYNLIKNIWFSLGGICIALGIVSSFVGFRNWIKETKEKI